MFLNGKLGKQIELIIEGGDTELDKGLTEKLVDPLTHLVRNSIDHGIESPALRAQRNKPATGNVKLNAYHESGTIVIEVSDDGQIVDAKFKTFGCGSAIASSSLATEWLKGKTIEECMAIKNTDIATHLKLPPVKLHCSMLAEDAIKAAVKDYQSKNVVEVTKTTAAKA